MTTLSEIEFHIPQESGEVFCYPRVQEFLDTARQNAGRLTESHLSLGGVALRDLRQAVRSRVLRDAAAYTSSALTITVRPPSGEALVIGTGHQPQLFHPGIWIKHLLVQRLAERGIVPFCVPVDSDAFEEIGADVPVLDGGLRMTHESLVRAPAEVPYESQPAPDKISWQAFLDRLKRGLRTLDKPDVEATFRRFRESSAQVSHGGDIGTFLTAARRRYEGGRPYLELPASRMSHMPEFYRFFLVILRDCPRFADAYNRHLDAYRDRYNVRTPAQPFPNLDQDGARAELPFWIISAGKRHTMYAEREGRAWKISTQEGTVASVPDADGPERLAGVEIRPKALTMTSFARLCLVDLMVHGVGGGRYDRVTDAVIAEYFGIQPPRYAVVTATLHLPIHEHNTDEERQRLQRRLLEIQHNPERALVDPSPDQQRLIDEKWKLIPSLTSSTLTRRERREMTQRIREINDMLSDALSQERNRIDRILRALPNTADADAAARHRAYPFCFFPPSAVDALIDRLVSNG